MSDYLKCPECGDLMVEREGFNKFYGCSRFPLCNGNRQTWEGKNKKVLKPEDVFVDDGHGECNRCGQYFSSRTAMGLCNGCQEAVDSE